jgi:tRNA U55 pseudouridine synthase TruB
MANGLDIMNSSNKPTFVTSNRQEVIDITIASLHAGNYIKDWHVTEEVSCSNHRYIRINVMDIDHSFITYRNPRRTDWESYRTDLSGCLSGMTDKINNFTDIEKAANQLQEAIAFAYSENCPLTMRENNRNTSW